MGTLAFIRQSCNEGEQTRALAQLSPEVREMLPRLKRVDWYPRAQWIELLRAVVSIHHDPVQSYEDLVSCGRYIAEDATNTFLRLLMKMLTPGLFARKFPEFWRRDNQGGRIEVDAARINENRVVMYIKDVEGFDHIGPVGAGYISFAMGAITGKPIQIALESWSLDRPGPPEVRYEVSW